MRLLRTVLVATCFVIVSAPVFGCSVVIPKGYEGSAKQLSDVRQVIAESSAIIDGQVIRPYVEGKQNALVLAYRVLKGPTQNFFEVGRGDSCTLVLDRVGERARMLLSAGPSVYLLYVDQSDARIEDRLLGSDRRRVWPYFSGQPAEARK